MAVKAYNTITLISIDDVNISMTEPESPVVDQLWLDTSKEPNELMRYDGTGWVRTQHDSLEDLDPGFKTEYDNQITSLGTTITERTTVGGKPVSEAITEIQAGQAEFVKISDIDGSTSTTIIDGGIIQTGTISADKINFDGATGTNVNLTGKITATSGKIGRWTISSGRLGSEDETVGIGGGGDAFWAGYNSSDGSYKFRVVNDGRMWATEADISGKITATSGKIGNWNIDSVLSSSGTWESPNHIFLDPSDNAVQRIYVTNSSGANAFSVSSNGALYANNANITGKITATSGTIGGWQIRNGWLDYKPNTNNNFNRFYLSALPSDRYVLSNYDSSGLINFTVERGGGLYATNANISGKITATSGKIGNWNIDSGLSSSGTWESPNHIFLDPRDNAAQRIYVTNSSGANAFSVSSNGALYANNANITGKITATSGKIGGWKIESSWLDYKPSSGNQNRFWLEPGGANVLAAHNSSGTMVFSVNSNGGLTATSATVTGTVTANSSSTLGGSLNSTSGRHNGTHYGYQSGTADNYSGTFGGVPYQGYSGTLVRLNGSLTINTGYLTCNRTLYANGGIVDGSDIHYKKDIHQKDNSSLMNEIYNLDVVSFKYKDNNKDSIGVIANNMVLESPTLSKYMVEPNPEGYLGVNYTSLNTASILAIQDLNKRLEKIERAMT